DGFARGTTRNVRRGGRALRPPSPRLSRSIGGRRGVALRDPASRTDPRDRVRDRKGDRAVRPARVPDDLPPEAPLEDRIDDTGRFETVVMTRYRWQAVYTAAAYVGLMETPSPHRLLPPDR